MSYWRRLAKIHKSSWDHKAEEQVLLRSKNTFAVVSLYSLLVPGKEGQRNSACFPRVPRESPEVRRKRFLSVVPLSNLEIYKYRVFRRMCFPRKSRLISRASPSEDPSGGNAHLHLHLVARLVANASVLLPWHNQWRKREKIKYKRDDLRIEVRTRVRDLHRTFIPHQASSKQTASSAENEGGGSRIILVSFVPVLL